MAIFSLVSAWLTSLRRSLNLIPWSRYFTALDTRPWQPGHLSSICNSSLPFSCAAEQVSQYHFPATVGLGDESLAEWHKAGQDKASTVGKDPQFANIANRNFALQPDSPAISAGFVELDLSTVGPRKQAGLLAAHAKGLVRNLRGVRKAWAVL